MCLFVLGFRNKFEKGIGIESIKPKIYAKNVSGEVFISDRQ